MSQVQVTKLVDGSQATLEVADFPNVCPICQNNIRAQFASGFLRENQYGRKELQLIFICPTDRCRAVFIGYYNEVNAPQRGVYYMRSSVEPKKVTSVEFSDTIKGVSPSFHTIYNQAHTAEELGLNEICGTGYRKALEFLIKDYLISANKSDEEKIKQEQLGTVIKNRVAHAQLKEVAKRATWLGNDETHYERKWADKDVKDLKILVDLTVRWIEMDKMTEQVMADMSEAPTKQI